MEKIKQNLPAIGLTVLTVFLAFLAIFTTMKLRSLKPVAPNVPQATPQAAGPVCRLSFTVSGPTPLTCNDACDPERACASGLQCLLVIVGGTTTTRCRNPQCSNNSDCLCATPTPTPTGTPTPTPTGTPRPTSTPTPTPVPGITACYSSCTNDAECGTGRTCKDFGGGTKKCVNPRCDSETDCVCNAGCYNHCGQDNECDSGQSCRQMNGDTRCVNLACQEKTNCNCSLAAQTPTPTPQVPVTPKAGSFLPTVAAALGGIVLLILGLAL